ncbi:DUF1631 domain-containing protein [Marinobacter daepoensis]|uniref:DUF1631 domain-containing protein n=1 Tax=Marinobacter daepoensis TaxID=262077 RepID=A0ABS3BK39_9GAMM|nr:DUF1631 domain-containing protein [Marinobacter daepoensis]MBN7771715.1 DUF1631 domain-containing protein [Marinobacter daepoensis]MBY6080893.1 DUF1631 domain-containing protein [Marinobacter daepoensis]
MANDNKVIRLASQKPVSRFSLPVELVRLRDTSGQSLKMVLASFFEQADDSLFALADRAGSNQDQTAYFDAMRELRLRRKAMTVSMLQYVSQAFNELGKFRPARSGGSLEEVDQDSLSLVDHADLEQQVAIDNLTNRLRNRYQEPVRMLAARIRHLVPQLRLTDDQMPLSPEVICGAIADACTDLDIDIRAKLVVLKLFERLLVDKLSDFYQASNKTLISAGVLVDMKRPPTGDAGTAKRPLVTGGGVEPTEHEGGPSGVEGRDQPPSATFSELSALLHQREEQGETVARSEGLVLDTNRLMARLNELQGSAQASSGSQDVVPLRQQLKPLLNGSEGQSLSVAQVDSDVINLVSMLFDFILEDRQLHPVMKALIGRLQIPVLKVALSDKNFFNRGGHPVRKLLNELALAAIGWSEKRAGMRDPLRDKIEEVVGRVLSEYTDRVDLFDELLRDFGHFMDLDRRRRELVEQRLRDAEEGRARQERASLAATELMREHTAGREVPEPVLQVLNEPWTRYLQWVVLREGEDSERWQHARGLCARLVWSVDPRPVSADTRAELLRTIPGIVEEFRKALQEISWDPFATDAAIRDLELAHVDVFQKLVTAPVVDEKASAIEHFEVVDPAPERQASPEPAETAEISEPAEPEVIDHDVAQPDQKVVEPASVEESATQASSPDLVDSASAEWMDKADSLRVGSWVEMARDDTRVRCKLAAFIRATGKYIFVNRSGAKVAEYHRDDLALALQKRDITMLDDGLIFDRALESIIDNLRHNRKD